MLRFVKMFGRMSVLRGVAASDVPAFEAEPQVNPRIAGLHTVFADVLGGFGHFDVVQMRAFSRHVCSPLKATIALYRRL